MNTVITTENLGKNYGRVHAVENLSLQVPEGEIYAFLGLNGAGKTTTIRMLLGMVKPTSGSARVLNTLIRPGQREPWSQVGYLVETPHAYGDLTVLENLEIARRLHPGTPPAAIAHMVDRLGLQEYADRRAGTLSLGNVQRLGLAKALLHHPRLLLLDEPANGLDPAGIVEIRTLLLELAHTEGCTIFMSSHILAEVSRLAHRIGIIHQGKLLQELDMDALEHNRKRQLLIGTGNSSKALQVLAASGHTFQTRPDGMLALTDLADIAQPDQIASLLVQAGVPLTHLVVEEEDLEQYFLRLVGSGAAQ